MTGAPKISAMKIIEDFEETKRGLYSGAVVFYGVLT
jgi:para-aminobenzoate synthetase component 1